MDEAEAWGVTGAKRLIGALHERQLGRVERALAVLPDGRPRVRVFRSAELAGLLRSTGVIGRLASTFLPSAIPVLALFFDKTRSANWALAWHQDRVICVRARLEAPGYGPWTRKHGEHHVQPPFDILSRMITFRVHLDDVDEVNAPLLVAPGSHRLGRISEADVPGVVERCGTLVCTAQRGDVWVYATPILHASEASRSPDRRRVLHIDYANEALPSGLEWAGIE